MAATVVAFGSSVNRCRRWALGSSVFALAVSMSEHRLALALTPATLSLNSQFSYGKLSIKGRAGCSVGPRWAQNTPASSRVSSLPANCRAWTLTIIWSMCCNASVPTPPPECRNSRHACGNRTSPITPCAHHRIIFLDTHSLICQ